ncbi:MAG: LysM peptidoglycan-binding domain-containing protein [Verrucomicrobiota bacterium]
MKMPKLLQRKKLRATTARRSLAGPEMDYEEMSEPNMKLSRALLIVLVLHVVAVAGIVAFNTIKTRQSSPSPVAVVNKVVPASANAGATAVDVPKNDVAKSSRSVSKTMVKPEQGKKKETGAAADTGKTYVVARGDNPVTIARKLKVSYDDLLALNHIDDPRKLQIGQKLLVPKTAKSKKAGE